MVGKIIVIEGIDGAGKATQSKLLKEKLESNGITVSSYSYPDYSSVYGARIKSFLYKEIKIKVDELFMLYLIDMVKDREKMINELKSGNYIIIDRFFFSTIAYQSAGGFDYDNCKKIIKLFDMPVPEITFFIDVPVDVSMSRKEKQKGKLDVDKFESNKVFLQNVSLYYKKLMEENFYSKKWKRIDGNLKIEEINDLIIKSID
ncbi:MAG: thymidylate kinase [Candidatus Parvarchaeum acidophilus ARMAN-5]|jgi:dTMP kinase|uniref:Probable thymidylate kinase n=1 Tax=Candidatus Parvarchaeum acidophilus ARMAN-5 TaxID=662762 RepID=D6GWU2_PARA5|nr:MAG: thymidylate kinase [Candidatus Parvarchaeum acidophilus ARMAN-5]